MSSENSQPPLQQASVVDIVTFGYKACVKSLWPITRLILPVVVLYSLCAGVMYILGKDIEASGQPGGLQIVLLIGTLLLSVVSWAAYVYMCFPLLRYIRDIYWSETSDSVFSYLAPRKSILGCAGIGLLCVATFIPAAIVGGIGLLFFVVPGVVVFSYYYAWFTMVTVVYMGNPERGVFDAMSETFSLFKGNLWRTVALSLLVWLISMTLNGPLFTVQFGLGMLEELSPSMARSPLFAVAYTVITGLVLWFSMAVSQGAFLFVMYRYLFDLRARTSTPPPAVNISEYQNRTPNVGNG